MSIPFSGCKSRSSGVISAIAKQLRSINYTPAKKITTQFDPFDRRSHTVRKFLFYLSAPKYLSTNPDCIFKTSIVCDRSEPTVTIDLVNGGKVVMKCKNLSTLELLQQYNKHVTSLVPKVSKEDEIEAVNQTKKKKKSKSR